MKILQIIPAPEECRIACLALVEDDDGQREIKPVPYDCDDPYGILEPESPFRMSGGQLYINGSYIKSGTLDASWWLCRRNNPPP